VVKEFTKYITIVLLAPKNLVNIIQVKVS